MMNKKQKVLTLLLIQKQSQILLAMKKRGFGCGKYNGFGGKVNTTEETIYQAAIRETQEEGSIVPTDAKCVGFIIMDFDCEPETYMVHIFKATQFQGTVAETEEMKPQWFQITDIPYEQMWVDDLYWMPLLIQGKYFGGYLRFEGHEKLLQNTIKELTEAELINLQKECEYKYEPNKS